MIEAVFIDPNNVQRIETSNANYLIVSDNGINQRNWSDLKKLGMELSISVNAFGTDGCPANPNAQEKLYQKIKQALNFKPSTIWIDHFRFDGNWERIREKNIPSLHHDCSWCKGKNRVDVIKQVAFDVMKLASDQVGVGYFAVPFKTREINQLITGLGQDHSLIGKIFDISSPMLYHRMIDRPTSYISEFVSWLSAETRKPVLPIIQVTNMPDVESELSVNEIIKAFNEAKKDPSIGIAFFWWTNALIAQNTDIISKLFA